MTALDLPLEQERQQAEAKPSRSPGEIALRSLLGRKLAVASFCYILLFYTVGILAPVLAPQSYTAQNLSDTFAGPSLRHPFGTDRTGRDMFSRVILATRTTVIVTVATALSGGFIIPVVLGLLAGYRGGWVDSIINRVGEALGSLPPLLLLILLSATIRPRLDAFLQHYYNAPLIGGSLKAGAGDLILIFVVLALIGWVGYTRLIRALVLSIRSSEYVQAAEAMGASTWRILLRHLLPNISWLVVLSVSSSLGAAALSEIALTFLGLGVRPPTPSFGEMLYNGSGPRQVAMYPHLLLIPGAVAILFFLAFNLLGDALNDILNPRTR